MARPGLAADSYLSQAGLLAQAQHPQQFQDLRHVSQGRVSSDFGPPQQQRGVGRLSTDYEYVPAFQDSHWHSYVSSVSGIDSMGAAGGLPMPPEEFHSLGSGLEPRPKSPTVAGSQGHGPDHERGQLRHAAHGMREGVRRAHAAPCVHGGGSTARRPRRRSTSSCWRTSRRSARARHCRRRSLHCSGMGTARRACSRSSSSSSRWVGGGGAIGAIGSYPSGGGNAHMHPSQMHGADHLKYSQRGAAAGAALWLAL